MSESSDERVQFSTFKVSGRMYGIDVTAVQEIVKEIPLTIIPLSRDFVKGLMNLRGQVVTAISVQELFEIPAVESETKMNVICTTEESLVSLVVDDIGDVIEVDRAKCDQPPATIPESVRKFIGAVYKDDNNLLSIIDIKKVCETLLCCHDESA